MGRYRLVEPCGGGKQGRDTGDKDGAGHKSWMGRGGKLYGVRRKELVGAGAFVPELPIIDYGKTMFRRGGVGGLAQTEFLVLLWTSYLSLLECLRLPL